jgi:hypothetical protein
MPFTVVVSELPLELLETEPTLLEVADIPFTTLVIVFPERVRVFVVAGIIPARLMALLATPLTVVVKLLPDKLLEIVPTAFEVADTPFTTLVRVFPERPNV